MAEQQGTANMRCEPCDFEFVVLAYFSHDCENWSYFDDVIMD